MGPYCPSQVAHSDRFDSIVFALHRELEMKSEVAVEMRNKSTILFKVSVWEVYVFSEPLRPSVVLKYASISISSLYD